MTSTLTGLFGRTHLWTQFRILSQPKRANEKTPHLGSQMKSSTLCGKRRLLAQSWRNLLLTINNRSIADCVQRPRLLYVRAVRFTSARSTQIWRHSLNAIGPFLISRIECRSSLKRWALAMIIIRAPSINVSTDRRLVQLLLCVVLHCLPRGPHSISTFHALTPNTKWARDPCGNGFDISQPAWYQQSNWIRWNSNSAAEGNR